MSPRTFVAGLPLATGSLMISIALLNLPSPQGAFIFEWMGSFLAFYGLSHLVGTRPVLPITGAILVAGSLGDIAFLGGLNPLEWIITNYMVFIHAVLGALTGHVLTEKYRTIIA